MGFTRVERLRALQEHGGLGREAGSAVAARAETARAGREAEHGAPAADASANDPTQTAAVLRLLALLEAGFLVAAADGELSPAEVDDIAANFSAWFERAFREEDVRVLLDTFQTALDADGSDRRLAVIADALEPDDRRAAFDVACAVAACDQARVADAEVALLAAMAIAFSIPEDEARARVDVVYEEARVLSRRSVRPQG